MNIEKIIKERPQNFQKSTIKVALFLFGIDNTQMENKNQRG